MLQRNEQCCTSRLGNSRLDNFLYAVMIGYGDAELALIQKRLRKFYVHNVTMSFVNSNY